MCSWKTEAIFQRISFVESVINLSLGHFNIQREIQVSYRYGVHLNINTWDWNNWVLYLENARLKVSLYIINLSRTPACKQMFKVNINTCYLSIHIFITIINLKTHKRKKYLFVLNPWYILCYLIKSSWNRVQQPLLNLYLGAIILLFYN